MASELTEAGFYWLDIEADEVPFAWAQDAILSAGADPIPHRTALTDRLQAMQTIPGSADDPRTPTTNALGTLGVLVGYADSPLAAVVGPLIDDVIVYIRKRQPTEYVLLSRQPCEGPQGERLARELAARRSAGMRP